MSAEQLQGNNNPFVLNTCIVVNFIDRMFWNLADIAAFQINFTWWVKA